MELRHLRYFIGVADALNFTRAAEKMRVAQPALSKQVQDLEDEIGVDLFRRSQRGVTLTAEGKLFLDEARQILTVLDEAVKKTQALARGEAGELNVGYASAPTVEILPQALTEFQQSTPKVALNLHDLSGNAICDGLRSGDLDLGIAPRPSPQNLHGLTFDLLKSYSLVVALPKGHPLAKFRTVKVEQLLDFPLVTYSKRDYIDYHRMLDDLFMPFGGAPRPSLEVDRATTLIAAVASGRGIALVTEIFRQTSGPRLVLRPIDGSDEAVSIGIVTANDADVTPAGMGFCSILKSIVGN